jgi:hypothetical protein
MLKRRVGSVHREFDSSRPVIITHADSVRKQKEPYSNRFLTILLLASCRLKQMKKFPNLQKVKTLNYSNRSYAKNQKFFSYVISRDGVRSFSGVIRGVRVVLVIAVCLLRH